MKLSSCLFALLGTMLVIQNSEAKDTKSVRGRRRVKDADLLKTSHPISRKLQAAKDIQVMQTFFVPMPEELTFTQAFYHINYKKARPPVEAVISVAISTDDTIVFWDHHEDGYDLDVTDAANRKVTTEVWGDGNAANGCAPHITTCKDSTDHLIAGDSIVIQNSVQIPRMKNGHMPKRYDGGDRVQSTYPIAVTRAAYPRKPGSLMAGAVEVLPTTNWGTHFEAPIGEDVGELSDWRMFEYTALFYMAGQNNTQVNVTSGGKVKTYKLKEGQGGVVRVEKGDTISSSYPIQVDLITGDLSSFYEMRWYSLLPVDQYSSAYVTPVGDTHGQTKVLCYNPSATSAITIRYKRLKWNNKKPQYYTTDLTLGKKQHGWTAVIPSGSGSELVSTDGKPFLALSLTDSGDSAGDGQVTNGQWYEWGFPVVPRDQLTSEVLVGWGYACTNNNCFGQTDRSVVWITPVADADIYVDYKNAGHSQRKISNVRMLQSIKITDSSDTDMSGAQIFAVKPGSSLSGDYTRVDIAAAYGQDPSVSYQYQSISLDLGTCVLPFTEVKVNKVADKQKVAPGETLKYSIIVSNVGQKIVRSGSLKIRDTLDPDVEYVTGQSGVTYQCSFDAANAALKTIPNSKDTYPFSNTGFLINFDIPRRGGKCTFDFFVKVKASIQKSAIMNTGVLDFEGTPLRFEEKTDVVFSAAISVANTVMLGRGGESACPSAVNMVEGGLNAPVTYCFKISNTGKTHLSSLYLVNEDLKHYVQLPATVVLAPNDSRTLILPGNITADFGNWVFVKGNPVFANGNDIPGLADVFAKDDSSVRKIACNPQVKIVNKVVHEGNAAAKCGTVSAVEKVVGLYDDKVTYCWEVTNEGNCPLGNVVIRNSMFQYEKVLPETLKPGKSVLVTYDSAIKQPLVNTATVNAKPALDDGSLIPGLPPCQHQDDSEVDKESFTANVFIDNRVYLGKDSGAKCGDMSKLENKVTDFYGRDVTFCFFVRNAGTSHLHNVVVTNPVLVYSKVLVGPLAPGETKTLYHEDKIRGNVVNMALVEGTPFTGDGRQIKDLAKPTDEDDSEVAKKLNQPFIKVDVKVLLGTDKEKCGTIAAKEEVKDFPGEPVVYCYVVTNTGDSMLGNVILTDPKVSFKQDVGRLSAGETKNFAHGSSIIGDLTNIVVAEGTPILDDGSRIPNTPDRVQSSDSANVYTLGINPSINVENTVYPGHDGGISCNKAVETVEGKPGAAVTYCFTVKNTGDTYLRSVSLYNVDLGFEDTRSIPPLAPGDSFVVTTPRYITRTFENVVEVVGFPVTDRGNRLPHDEVTDADESSVSRISVPSIDIDNKVALSSDESDCKTEKAMNKVTGLAFADVVYCFAVTNNGDTTLGSVTVVNEVLDYEIKIDRLLEPNQTIMLPLTGKKITEDLENIALVTGTPVYPNGTEIPGLHEVEDCDPSEVAKRTFGEAKIGVKNTVYAGGQSPSRCGTSDAGEMALGLFGSDATYCFEIQNSGPTHLRKFSVKNKEVPHFEEFDILLAPGDTKMLQVPSKFIEKSENIVYVSAQPATPEGEEILDMGRVTANDPSGVALIPHKPNVTIDNTVYLGTEGEGKCGTEHAKDTVQAQYGHDVVYCLKVQNTGDTYLDNIVIEDELLKFMVAIDKPLAPHNDILIPVPRKLTQDLTNIATVTANPVTKDGVAIPHDDVTDSDDSHVVLVAQNPKVTIINEVTEGSDCGKDDTSDSVENFLNTNVTYCFTVKNTGDSFLCGVIVSNDVLGYTHDTIASLGKNEVKMISVAGSIKNNLTNVAHVVGTPCLENGNPIPTTPKVEDDDDSSVKVRPYNHDISIENTVYAEHNGGAHCGTSIARESVKGLYGTPVTYCFVVTNKGDNVLIDLKITNEILDGFVDTSIKQLGPKASAIIYVEKEIKETLENVAVVEGIPADIRKEKIQGLTPVSDDDESSVVLLPTNPSIKVTNVVYVGTEEDDKCGSTDTDRVRGIYNTQVVYCFLVKNTGDTYLDNVTVTNEKLSNFFLKLEDPLQPGETYPIIQIPGYITDDWDNTVYAEGNPVDDKGVDIKNESNVKHKASSGVEIIHLTAAIEIINENYPGHGDTEGCSEAKEKTTGLYGTNVTFCLTVKNNGKTALDKIVIKDEKLAIVDLPVKNLMPGENTTLAVPGIITEDTPNTATVTGYPCLTDGTELPYDAVVAEDRSEVGLIPFVPSIHIENEVYLGHDDGASCNTDAATESQSGYGGTLVTYCFTVTNTGNSYLDNIEITNGALGFLDSESVPLLAPNESIQISVAFESTIDSTLDNIAIVTADPVLFNGKLIGAEKVTDDDGSGVIELEYSPRINITNVVYIGDDVVGGKCSTGLEVVEDSKDTPVVYCFNVTNVGNTYLSKVTVTNDVFGLNDNTIGTLAPGEHKLIPYKSTITKDLVNTAVAMGVPSMKANDQSPVVLIDGADPVQSSDPSKVLLKILADPKNGDKDPYAPPTDDDECLMNVWKDAGKTGELVCATRDVFIESAKATDAMTCNNGDLIEVTVDGSIRILKGGHKDIGWYVAVDAGDALDGKCVVNGFQDGNAYLVADAAGSSNKVGTVTWTDDKCGDVSISSGVAATIDIPIIVKTKLQCSDDDGDGEFDFAICFTWNDSADVCSFSKNIPAQVNPNGMNDGCFCTRVNVPNIEVITTLTDPIAPC